MQAPLHGTWRHRLRCAAAFHASAAASPAPPTAAPCCPSLLQKGDIWSCGVLLYILVTDRYPFRCAWAAAARRRACRCSQRGRPHCRRLPVRLTHVLCCSRSLARAPLDPIALPAGGRGMMP